MPSPSARPSNIGLACLLVTAIGIAAVLDPTIPHTAQGLGPPVPAVDLQDPAQPRIIARSNMLPGVVSRAFLPIVSRRHLPASNPMTSLRLVDMVNGPAWAVALTNTLAYYAENRKLIAVDLSDPAHPTAVGATELLGDTILDVALSGRYAYLAAGADGLAAVDISDPRWLPIVSRTRLPDVARAVAIDGTVLYIAFEGGQFSTYSLADPTHPVLLGSVTLAHHCRTLTIADGFAYVGARGEDALVSIIDVRQPGRLRRVGEISAGEPADEDFGGPAVAVADGFAYLPGGASGWDMQVVDVADPTRPRPLGLIDPVGSEIGRADLLAVHEHRLWVVWHQFHDTDLSVFDLAVPPQPKLLSTTSVAPNWLPVDMAISEGRLVVTSLNNGTEDSYNYRQVADGLSIGSMTVVDTRQPSSPVNVGTYGPPSWPWTMTQALTSTLVFDQLRGGTFSLGRGRNGTAFLNRRAEQPALAQAWQREDGVMFTLDKLADATMSSSCVLSAHDVTETADVKQLGQVTLADCVPGKVLFDGTRAYVYSSAPGKFFAVDAADPRHLVAMGTVVLQLPLAGILGNRAYLAGPDGLHVWDVSDPTVPHDIGVIAAINQPTVYITPRVAIGLQFEEKEATMLTFVDLRTPFSADGVSRIEITNLYVDALFPVGSKVICLASNHNIGVLPVVDVSDPLHPKRAVDLTLPLSTALLDDAVIVYEGAVLNDTAWLMARNHNGMGIGMVAYRDD